jgi:hypothetical protein
MLASTFGISPYGPPLATLAAAEVFWALFIVGFAAAYVSYALRTRHHKHPWSYYRHPRPR